MSLCRWCISGVDIAIELTCEEGGKSCFKGYKGGKERECVKGEMYQRHCVISVTRRKKESNKKEFNANNINSVFMRNGIDSKKDSRHTRLVAQHWGHRAPKRARQEVFNKMLCPFTGTQWRWYLLLQNISCLGLVDAFYMLLGQSIVVLVAQCITKMIPLFHMLCRSS